MAIIAVNWVELANLVLKLGGLGPVAAHCEASVKGQQHQSALLAPEWSISAADGDIRLFWHGGCDERDGGTYCLGAIGVPWRETIRAV